MPSQYAWWMMRQKEKDALQKARERGEFGGMVGKAPYMWIQEGSTAGGARGAARAGLKRTRKFIAHALDEGHRDMWGFIINEVFSSIGT
jgi:hypothetical protein